MDRATKIYAYFLLAVGLGFVIWILYEDPQVARLNDRLTADEIVSGYPYPFRVFRMEGATAVMGTPRSPEVPVRRILKILAPEVSGGPDTPGFQRAQKELAEVQGRARRIVADQPEVSSVRWELDRTWLSRHGVTVTP